MKIFLSFIGIIMSFVFIKYRERVAEMIGEAEWMNKVGGVYNVVVLFGIFIFFWSIATLTGTNMVLFSFVKYIIPGLNKEPAPETIPY